MLHRKRRWVTGDRAEMPEEDIERQLFEVCFLSVDYGMLCSRLIMIVIGASDCADHCSADQDNHSPFISNRNHVGPRTEILFRIFEFCFPQAVFAFSTVLSCNIQH